MTNVLVVGSVAFDTVETPFGKRDAILGGAATHFALSARHFAKIRLVGVVGEDFPSEHVAKFKDAGVDTAGLVKKAGKTFTWHGKYLGAMDTRETVDIGLGVFGDFEPEVPETFRDTQYVHLGTAHPDAQARTLDQLPKATFVMLDTIDLWIQNARKELLALLPRIHALCINHEEALMLADKKNLARATRELVSTGLPNLIIKRAEHGSTLVTKEGIFAAPSFPTEDVIDPTGAGDAFAGGVVGYLSAKGTEPHHVRKSLLYGAVMGSFAVEGFGTEGVERASADAIEERIATIIRMITL